MGVSGTSTFHAPDIECERCADAIRAALGRLDGVRTVLVDTDACTVRVEHDHAQVGVAAIRAALAEAGYPTSP